MKVRDVMKTAAITVRLDDSVSEAARLMRDHGIGFLPVVDENTRVCGVITDRDIVARVVACDAPPNATRVVDAMTLELVRVHQDDDIDVAAHAMSDTHKGRVLVTGDDDVLEGVVSLSDLADLDDFDAQETLRDVSARENKGHDDVVVDGGLHGPR